MTSTEAAHRQLEELADGWRSALGANDASSLPLATSLRYTENGQDLGLDEGLWATASAPAPPYLTIADVEQDQVICLGVIEEGGEPAIQATRLRRVHGLVTEIETLVARRRGEMFGAGNMGAPRPVLVEMVPEQRRRSRDRLGEAAHLYFDGIERNDGSIIPCSAGCTRWENGTQTVLLDGDSLVRQALVEGGFPDWLASATVADQISSGCFSYIAQIRDRRIVAVDLERQLVVAWAFFEHRGEVTSLPELGVARLPDIMCVPSSFMIAEVFKLDDGEITAIEAVGEFFPLGMTSGWPQDPVRGAHPLPAH